MLTPSLSRATANLPPPLPPTTIFISFAFPPSRGIYGPAFKSIATKSGVQLGLRENDYVFGDLKVKEARAPPDRRAAGSGRVFVPRARSVCGPILEAPQRVWLVLFHCVPNYTRFWTDFDEIVPAPPPF